MVGDSIDPLCPAVLGTKHINVSSKGISNLSGIEVFVNDTSLNCYNNQLTTLPPLPLSLTYLECRNNQITTLPNLPSSLTTLDCRINLLTSLPTLPSSLTRLDCRGNQLTSIPNLPSSITDILCSSNQLSSLPVLPSSLIYLSCGSNQITYLPALPTSLTFLECSLNQLTALPALPSTLLYLTCSFNQLITLPVLPSSLTELVCRDNQLTLLPNLPSTLTMLWCQDNQLTFLPSLPTSLTELRCENNQLASLPPLPSSLIRLYCQYNPLTCLPDLNQVTDLNFYATLVECVPNYGIVFSSTPFITTLPICDVFNSNGCELFWNIEGEVFFDPDTNCIVGNNEPYFTNQKVKLYKNGMLVQQTYVNTNGDYFFDTFAPDFYKTELDTLDLPFATGCPSSGFYTDTISAVDSMKYNRNFGLICKGVDLAVTSIYSNNIRPASVREIKIQAGDYSNTFGANCANGISGTVVISITGPCNYLFPGVGALTPDSVNGNVLTYNVADFGAMSNNINFNFTILVDTNATLGNQICIQVSISTSAAELNYSNNYFSQCFTVVGSYDPNDKSVYPASTLDISGDRWLTYLIRFQNTGTADAEHIYITDTLSTYLEWSTFSLLSYSHQPITQIYQDGLLKFSFPNIHLPDSNSNEPGSHGYIQFKIRAKDSLAIGSTIENTANIFFDFNAPIITNTTANTLINCSIPPTIINATICNSLNFQLNGVTYSTSGNHVQRFITANGCDSTILLNLTINSSASYLSGSICDGDFYNFNGQQLSLTGVYNDTLTNASGCDSIVVLDLIINNAYNIQRSENICTNDSLFFGGVYLYQAGIYIDSLPSVFGCDSVITLNLDIINANYTQQAQTICSNDSILFGSAYLHQSGVYFDSLLNSNGCDSIIELQLTVTPVITNIVSQISSTLQTTASGSTYQWIDCGNNSAINGATNSTFQPTQSGSYAVAVTYGNCIDTSTCYTFSTVGLPSSITADVIFQTRYLSSSENILLHAEKLRGTNGQLRLMDLSGRIIYQQPTHEITAGKLNLEIPVKGLNAGIYIVNLITEKDNISGKVIKY
jgi:uncharacterized repeat protein (TIGR01451 family)